ncbi:MAG TPA: hypothetical protein PKM20_03150 [Nitrosomonas sp.]|uniref:hypothetical protein n=1 Tax=Nitrosomonas sp. TaxID=42353 RepID=UPI000E8A17F5|nr:hypothetical protein [Nitrosomonas sp.]GJL74337.1 MAG: hypothetical protein NMNS02_04430 [Nitrosomonas sp.]HBV20265.1 hypothetical protein [Nitrosomonas sp.]HNP25715.1 hypothetical protein [Nitrosomonas sp.]
MRFIFVSITILISSLLFYPFNALALHHEETQTVAAGKQYPNNEGKVVDVLDTTGYTYMELENGDRRFWIAAPTTKVNKGDHIRFVESMSMENFTSKTLNRTFRRVIFVSSTMIKK